MADRGLTPFLVAMMKAPETALAQALADTGPLAAKYDVPQDYAAWYIRSWLARSR